MDKYTINWNLNRNSVIRIFGSFLQPVYIMITCVPHSHSQSIIRPWHHFLSEEDETATIFQYVNPHSKSVATLRDSLTLKTLKSNK